MKFLDDPFQESDSGIEIPLPQKWQNELLPGATYSCCGYKIGSILKQHLAFDSVHIHAYKYDIHTAGKLYQAMEETNTTFQFALKGDLNLVMNGKENLTLNQSRYCLFYFSTVVHRVDFTPGEFETVYVELPRTYLRGLVNTNEHVASVYERLEQQDKRILAVGPLGMNHKIKASLNEMLYFKIRRTNIASLFAAIYSILSIYLDELTVPEIKAEPWIKLPHREKLQKIKDEICMAPNARVQTTKYFQQQYEIAARDLTSYFAIAFGTSLLKFKKEQCLKKAMFLLETTQKTIDDIADEVGYDSTNFARLFKEHFSFTPHEVRWSQLCK